MNIRYFLICLLLAGCAPVMRNGAPMTSQVVLPPGMAASVPNKAAEQAMPENWWRRFDDPQLDQAVETALRDNPSLAAVRDRIAMAQDNVANAESLRYVHVNGVANIAHQELSKTGNHDIYNGKTSTIATVLPFDLNYNLDLWGRNAEIIAASQADEAGVRARYRMTALMLSASVIQTYFTLQASSHIIAVQNRTIALLKDRLAVETASYAAGISTIHDKLAAAADLQEANEKLAQLQHQNDALQYALLALLGKSPGEHVTVSPELPAPAHFSLPDYVGIDSLANRPDVQVALWRIRKQSHLEQVAQKAFYPDINLFALAGFNSFIGLHDLFQPESGTYAFGPAINLPIFEGGALESRLHGQEDAYDAAVHLYNHTVLEAARQVADAFSGLQHSKDRLDEETAALGLKVSASSVAQTGFATGITGRLPWIDAAIAVNREQIQHIHTSLDWLDNITMVATSLGGGFEK